MKSTAKERNLGIELLRIVSMFAIVMLHVLGYGGVLGNISSNSSLTYFGAWFLEVLCFFGVTTFALISGFVGADGNYRLTNVVYVWLQVIFYTIIFSVIFIAFGVVGFSKELIVNALFPVTTGQYWYFSAYVPVFFIMPLVNASIEKIDKKTSCFLVCIVAVLFSVWPVLFTSDVFKVNDGYSVIWIFASYYIGAYIKKSECFKNVKSVVLMSIFVIALLLTYLMKILADSMLGHGGDRLLVYNSPTVLVMSVTLLVVFSRINITNALFERIIKGVSPLCFGVYLTNCHPLVWEYVIRDRFSNLATYSLFKMVVCSVLSALVIFLIGIAMDGIRKLIFDLGNLKQKLNIVNDYIFKE